MTVAELIEQLKKCPQHLRVVAYYDGSPRTLIDCGHVTEVDVYSRDLGDYTLETCLVLAEEADIYPPRKDFLFNEEA